MNATIHAPRQTGGDRAHLKRHAGSALTPASHETANVPAIQQRRLGYGTSEDGEHISAASDRTALRFAQSGPSLDQMGGPHTNGLITRDLAWTLSPAWHDRERTTAISGVLTALATRAGQGLLRE